MINQLTQPPRWIFIEKVPLDDSRVLEILQETGGFHDSYLSLQPEGDGLFAIKLKAPYFWKSSATGLWGVEAANFLLRCDLARDHGEFSALSGIYDFDVYSIDVDKSSNNVKLSIEVFFDIHLSVVWEDSSFFWTFRN